MKRFSNLSYLAALFAAFATVTLVSCIHTEVDIVPGANIDPSKSICFGAEVKWTDEDQISRSDSARSNSEESTVTSEDNSLSLPLIISQQPGINTDNVAVTRGEKITEGTKVPRMRVWATYTKEGTKSLYFVPGADGTQFDASQGLDFERNDAGVYYSTPEYMWPGDGTFDFVALANLPEGIGNNFVAALNSEGNAPQSFTYTIPEEAESQHDLMIAKAPGISGGYTASVPMNFSHIMAAVNFKVGSVVAGTIKSITLKGIYNKATYLVNENVWVGHTVENEGIFTANIGGAGNIANDNNQNGNIINDGAATFMMIPQSLFTGAEIEVAFTHPNFNDAGPKDVTLRAAIQGNNWAMNTTTNYLINITREYQLQIVPLDNVLDAHYIITKVEITSEYDSWELEVEADDGADVTIEHETDVNPMAKQGFWTDKKGKMATDGNGKTYYYVDNDATSARGGKRLYGGVTTNHVVYVFVPENVSNKTRNITLSIYGLSNNGDDSEKEIVLTQKPVHWYNPKGTPDASSIGLELLIENGQIDWGFCWEGISEEYTTDHGGWGQYKKVPDALANAGFDLEQLRDTTFYISIFPDKNAADEWVLQINYDKIGNIEIAEDPNNGYENTLELYNFDGISTLSAIKDFIGSYPNIAYTSNSGQANIANTLDFAAMYALKRNRFHLFYQENVDGDVDVNIPFIEENDIKWYLPAKEQFKQIIDLNANWGQQFTFNDSYWTSTAFLEQDGSGSKSYSYNNMVETVSPRTERYLTMAVRQYTVEANVEIGGNTVSPGSGGENNSGNEKPGSGDNAGDIGGGTGN